MTVRFNTVVVDGLRVFFRSAGDPDAPAVLLLHGFPSASHMFRDLIPELADRYHVVAPDLPGFGMTEQPSRAEFAYTFANIARVIGRFTEVLGLRRFALYVFDYGAPVGFRLALAHPDRISAIVSQNGNAYHEGLSEAFAPMQAYWTEPTPVRREALRGLLTPETTLFQYTSGVSDPTRVAPDGRMLDDGYLARPGNDEIQLDLLGDYRTNVALYGTIQAYLRERRPPVLAIWGRNDPFFLPAGAEAFRRDVPEAAVRFVDTGHFALETHATEIGAAMREFLAAHVDGPAGGPVGGPAGGPDRGSADRADPTAVASPTEIVRDFYARLAVGDAPGALGLLAADVEWTTMWHYKVEGRGPAAVATGLFTPLLAEWTRFSLVPDAFIHDGDTVVSLGAFEGVHAVTGKTARARYAHVWTVRHGKIERFRQHIDTLAVAEARNR